MLAGLNKEEKGIVAAMINNLWLYLTIDFSFFLCLAKLNLQSYNIHNLKYLNKGDLIQNETEDSRRFEAWKVRHKLIN